MVAMLKRIQGKNAWTFPQATPSDDLGEGGWLQLSSTIWTEALRRRVGPQLDQGPRRGGWRESSRVRVEPGRDRTG